jgi:hypothetical protein
MGIVREHNEDIGDRRLSQAGSLDPESGRRYLKLSGQMHHPTTNLEPNSRRKQALQELLTSTRVACPQLSIDPVAQRAMIEKLVCLFARSIAVQKPKELPSRSSKLSLEGLLCGMTILEPTHSHFLMFFSGRFFAW